MLVGRKREGRFRTQVADVLDTAPEAPRRSEQNGVGECFVIVSGDEIAERAGPIELAISNACRGVFTLAECVAEMEEVVEPVEEQPGTEAFDFLDQIAGGRIAAPYGCAAFVVCPDGNDARSRVLAPEPLVFDCRDRRRCHALRLLAAQCGIRADSRLNYTCHPEQRRI